MRSVFSRDIFHLLACQIGESNSGGNMRKAEGGTAALSRLGAAEVTTLTDTDGV
jgi:hypothetical protein